MAVLGVQLVVTLFTATLMHRLAPHCSFARWLLCNGSLFRYIHPSEEELRALSGKLRPRVRKERWANGLHDEKPLSVPRDAHFQLQTCPLTAVDALVLRFFLEYQWFVDFAVYSVGVYLFTEAYYFVLGPVQETNIAVFWCLLTLAFSLKVFLMVTRLYFSTKEGGERSVCLSFAFLFLLLAMLVQVVREETLELGLEPGLASMTQHLEPILKKQDWDWTLPVIKLAIRLGLAVLGSLLGAFLIFPGLRLAQTHQDALTLSADRPLLQPSEGAFDSLRLWVLVALCLLRLAVTRPHLQAYLCLAKCVCVEGARFTEISQPSEALIPVDPAGDEAQQTAAQVAGILGGLLTPLFLRGMLAYIIWWTAACQLLSSLFGLYFHQHLAAS